MNEPQRLAGTYLLGLEPMLVSIVDGEILLRLDGVPEEFAARLVGSDNSYVVRGSQLEGATLHFNDGEPTSGGQLGGVIDFVRSDEQVTTTSGSGLLLGPVDWEETKRPPIRSWRTASSNTWTASTSSGFFLGPSGVSSSGFRGKANSSSTAHPSRASTSSYPGGNSVEIMDQGGTGNRAAVYASGVRSVAAQVRDPRRTLMSHILLIHGACHGAWCWDDVAVHLAESGHRPIAVDLPCDDHNAGLAAYADTAISSLPPTPDDLIVVGHSLGALTAAVVAGRVATRRLVFVAGIIGSPGMSLADLATVDADRDGHLGKEDLEFQGSGFFRFSRAGAMRALFHDCEAEAAELALARLRFQRSMWTEVADFDDWRADEIISIVCTDDRVVNATWGKRVSRERLGVEAIDIAGGHSPWLSRPSELARMLIE